jgi:hypothetical protein
MTVKDFLVTLPAAETSMIEVESDLATCFACQEVCIDLNDIKSHIRGKKHLKKSFDYQGLYKEDLTCMLDALPEDTSMFSITKQGIACSVCKVQNMCYNTAQLHVQEYSHKEAVFEFSNKENRVTVNDYLGTLPSKEAAMLVVEHGLVTCLACNLFSMNTQAILYGIL